MERKKVLKFPLPIGDEVKIELPKDAECLCVQAQYGQPCLWIIGTLDGVPIEKWFCVRGTGHDFKGNEGKYIGTFQLVGGKLVFHVFERLEEGQCKLKP
jgi:hypothetical protein